MVKEKNRTKIYQNEKQGITVATFYDCLYDVQNYINKKIRNIYWEDPMPDKITAKVRVRTGDVYDSHTGMVEACKRADAKHSRYFKRGLKNYCEYCLRRAFAVSPELTEEVYKEMTEKRKEKNGQGKES